jgi:hypothetical protein
LALFVSEHASADLKLPAAIDKSQYRPKSDPWPVKNIDVGCANGAGAANDE